MKPRTPLDGGQLFDRHGIDEAGAAATQPQLDENAAGWGRGALAPLDVDGTFALTADVKSAGLHDVRVERCLRDAGKLVRSRVSPRSCDKGQPRDDHGRAQRQYEDDGQQSG